MGWVEAAKWNMILGIAENTAIVLCTWYFVSHIETDRDKKPAVRIAAFLLYGIGLILSGAYFPPSGYEGLSLLAFMVAVTLSIGHFMYNQSSMYLFYYFLFPVSIFIMQTLVSYTVFSYNFARWGMIAFDYYNDNVALISRSLSLLLLTGAWVLLLNRKNYENVTRMQFAGLFLPPIFSIFIIASLIMLGNVYVQMYGAFLIVINITFLVLMNVYILYLFTYLSKNRRLRAELEILNRQRELQYSYYEKLERKYQESRRLIHDMRNHLQAMESLVREGDDVSVRGYADDMYQMLDTLGQAQYCENKMMNIILNDKAESARAAGIRMDIAIGDTKLGQMKDIDITTIFANLLDNAIEAASYASSNKYIKMRTGAFHDFAVIKIQNSMPRQEVKDVKKDMLRKPASTKAAKHMGIGLKNVQRTLEKYGGGIQTETDGQTYKVSITIPVERKNEDKNEDNSKDNNEDENEDKNEAREGCGRDEEEM